MGMRKMPDPKTQAILESLQKTATKTLERKRKLGHYAVVWQDGAPLMIGEDAPEYSVSSVKDD